jgi:hypothetical protein
MSSFTAVIVHELLLCTDSRDLRRKSHIVSVKLELLAETAGMGWWRWLFIKRMLQ